MTLSINNNGFSLEGLKLQSVYNDRRYSVIIDRSNYDNFKALAKASGFDIINIDLMSSTKEKCVVKIELPKSWAIKITM